MPAYNTREQYVSQVLRVTIVVGTCSITMTVHLITWTCILHKGTQVVVTTAGQGRNKHGKILQITSKDIQNTLTTDPGDFRLLPFRRLAHHYGPKLSKIGIFFAGGRQF